MEETVIARTLLLRSVLVATRKSRVMITIGALYDLTFWLETGNVKYLNGPTGRKVKEALV